MLCLGSPDMLSGYDLSQLCMRKVGLTDPPEVSGQVSYLTCRQRERERGIFSQIVRNK